MNSKIEMPDELVIKMHLLTKLEQELFIQEDKKYQENLDAIIEGNAYLHGNTKLVMSWRGTYWYHSNYRRVSLTPVKGANLGNPCHNNLVKKMETLQAARQDSINKDRTKITSYLRAVSNFANTREEYKDLLPEALHYVIDNSVTTTGFYLPGGRTKTTEEVEAFKAERIDYLNLIKRQMFNNLISA